jgi:hypothetical protein
LSKVISFKRETSLSREQLVAQVVGGRRVRTVWTQFQLGVVTGRVHHDDKGVTNKRGLCSLIKMSYLACSTNDLQLEALFLVVVVKL